MALEIISDVKDPLDQAETPDIKAGIQQELLNLRTMKDTITSLEQQKKILLRREEGTKVDNLFNKLSKV